MIKINGQLLIWFHEFNLGVERARKEYHEHPFSESVNRRGDDVPDGICVECGQAKTKSITRLCRSCRNWLRQA